MEWADFNLFFGLNWGLLVMLFGVGKVLGTHSNGATDSCQHFKTL